ncbi:MAG: CsgG/HfaB family protein [bacterium]
MHRLAILLTALSALPAAAQPIEAPAAGAPPAPLNQDRSPAKGKATLAVLPLEAPRGGVAAADLQGLDSALVRAFVQSNKFDVIERTRIEAIIAENRFATSSAGAPANAAQMGRLTGARYVVLGRVQEQSTRRRTAVIPYVDERTCRETSRLRVELRVVQAQSGRIVATAQGPNGSASGLSGRCGSVSSATWGALAERAAAALVSQVVDGVFPLQVVHAGLDEVTLNRGAGGELRVGSSLECFTAGDAIVDPDTGDVLGRDETAIGRAVVTEVRPKLSKARPADGAQIPLQSICRIVTQPTAPPKRAAAAKPKPKVNW